MSILDLLKRISTMPIFQLASPTYSALPSSARYDVGIFFREFMSIFTVSLSSVKNTNILTTFAVDSARNRLKVCGVNATSTLTQVVKLESFGNWPDEHLVRYAMTPTMPLASSVTKSRISFAVQFSIPQPARRTVKSYVRVYANLFKETREKLGVYGKSVRIVVGHRGSPKVNDGLGDVRLVPCAAFSF